jgi:hypothetical protein
MKRILLGSLIAGAAVFVWGFLFWGVSGLPDSALSRTTDDAAAGQALLNYFPETGSYYLPGPHNDADQLKALHESGPIAFVYFNREGKPLMSPILMLYGFMHGVLIAVLVGIALGMLGNALPTYGDRVKLVALFGLGSSIWIPLSDSIWWYFPLPWQLWKLAGEFTSWLVLGLVLAYFVRAKPTPA